VHRHSPRAENAFIKLNCAALQPTLVESELFGHEKGAFTGATQQRQGRFELADGGTIFLDEVSEIPLELQAKLLRVLQEGQFERVGGGQTRKVDVRVIAATNRRLNEAVVGGKFRADLFYRLNVYPITVPPLRAHPEDIPPLVEHFTSRIAARMGKKIETIPAARLDTLMAYDWPGNVRELGNAIERAMVLGEDEQIRPEDLPDEVLDGGGTVASDYQTALLETKKKLVQEAFEKGDGDYAAAARVLGIHVNSLHRLIRQLGIKEELGK
jgi:transcriptional regulator with GAF, ATPase, and Fis domain